MKAKLARSVLLVSGLAAAAVLGTPAEAQACGGFFCSATQPVNQSAERIVFADNGDGTVTAVIQIMYQGPSQNFSWLLPISTVPQGNDLAVASNIGFARLQAATNPQYNLTTRVEGMCSDDGSFGNGGVPTAAPGASVDDAESPRGPGGVTVEATGIVGAFEWTVISLDDSLADPAAAAVSWLEANGYDVSDGARELLGPYLRDGLYLLALRLTKGSDTGSIRPIVLRYSARNPMIPIKLTAVAANADMGVMTWLLSTSRGVPENYRTLELNEARINWFNAASNYNSVVNQAADDSGGQGFVTEFAGPSSTLAETIWSSNDDLQWQSFQDTTFGSFQQIFNQALAIWGTWDGFWDAVRTSVTLPAGIAFADFQQCPNCYSSQVQLTPSAFIGALDTNVIQPVRDMQTLFNAHPHVTRLYTTMSAEEMTTDPLFTFNPDLPDVSNIHAAERVIECNPMLSQFEAPWRIELPQGGVIRGTAMDLQMGNWPVPAASQPANRRILQLSDSGPGSVVKDNSDPIDDANHAGSSGGCSLGAASRAGTGVWMLGALAGLVGLLRRRRAKA